MEAEEGACIGVESADEHVCDEDDTASSAVRGASRSEMAERGVRRAIPCTEDMFDG